MFLTVVDSGHVAWRCRGRMSSISAMSRCCRVLIDVHQRLAFEASDDPVAHLQAASGTRSRCRPPARRAGNAVRCENEINRRDAAALVRRVRHAYLEQR